MKHLFLILLLSTPALASGRVSIFVTGFLPSADNNGLNVIAAALPKDGRVLKQAKYTDDIVSMATGFDWVDLTGYSFGGNAVVDASFKLGLRLKTVVLLDPVHYGVWSWFFGGDFKAPIYAINTLCIKKSFGLPPSWGCIDQLPIVLNRSVKNIVISTANHASFPTIPEVSSAAIARLSSP